MARHRNRPRAAQPGPVPILVSANLRFRTSELRAFATAALKAAGVVDGEAELVAEVMIDAQERGYDSQGVMRLPSYLRWAKSGQFRSPATLTVTRTKPSALAVDGGNGWGAVVTTRVMDMCVERARETGSCFAAVGDVGHCGRLGYYVERAAERGMIGILALSGSLSAPVMAPWGGTEARLSTNPIAFGFPYPGGAPVVIDISTTQAARGKIAIARTTGQSIPEGWALDAAGEVTTDADQALPPHGTMAPLGGHKGYALAVAVELMSAAIAGAYPREGDGMFVAAFDIGAVTEPDLYAAAVAALDASIRSSAPREGFAAPVLPGTGSAERKARAQAEGVEVAPEIWRQVSDAAAGLGIEVPEPAR
jgi:LDH2 family malate/lactate/ureidoglycolate dehydrogenase